MLYAAGALSPSASVAQESGSPEAAVAGAALGLASGATLAFVGSLVPCTQTRPGPACVRWTALGGGVLALTGGALLGAADANALSGAAVGGGIGFLVGSAAGLVLRSRAERFSWQDVAVVGLFGGAIGAAPLGSSIGLLGGAAAGLVARGVWDSVKTPDLFGAAAAGLALGGIVEWLVRGIEAQSSDGPEMRIVLPLAVGI